MFSQNCKAELPESSFRQIGRSHIVTSSEGRRMFKCSTATPHAIEAALTFLVRSGAKPKVLMPADPADRVERTGTYEAVPVVINDARHQRTPPTSDREGFALVRSPTAVTDFYDPAVVEGRLVVCGSRSPSCTTPTRPDNAGSISHACAMTRRCCSSVSIRPSTVARATPRTRASQIPELHPTRRRAGASRCEGS